MQRYAVHVLAMTYLRVPLPVLAEVRQRGMTAKAGPGGAVYGFAAAVQVLV